METIRQRINMETRKHAVTAELKLKLLHKKQKINKETYIHQRRMLLAADAQTLNDVDSGYCLSLLFARKELPSLSRIPGELVLDPDADT